MSSVNRKVFRGAIPVWKGTPVTGKELPTAALTTEQIRASLQGLGEIWRSIDELYRVRLPLSWQRIAGLATERWRVCFWRRGELRVVPVCAWPAFEQQQRPLFSVENPQITFENTVVAPAKDIQTESGGNGWRWCLQQRLVDLARIDIYKRVVLRPNSFWVDVWDEHRRNQWWAALRLCNP